MSIKQEELKWKIQQKKKKAPTKKEWLFLRKIDQPDKKLSNWRIKDKHLEVDVDAIDILSQTKFTELISDAQKAHVPFIFIALRSGENYYFYSGTTLLGLYTKWKDPITRAFPDVVEIYVVGEDGRPTFLMEIKQKEDIDIFFIEKQYDSVFGKLNINILMKKELAESGYGHLFIAKLFNEAAGKGLEIRRFEEKIKQLQKETSSASAQRVNKIFKEIDNLREKIKKLSPSKKDPIFQQYARQWFVWAIKYLKNFEHPKSSLLAEAKRERDKIRNRPELLRAEREAPDQLTKNLQNLTVKLRQLSHKLR